MLDSFTGKSRLSFITVISVLALTVSFLRPSPVFAQIACSSTGQQNVAVILVNMPGAPLPSTMSVAAAQDMFFGTNTPGPNVASLLQEASYNQVQVTGQVLGPYTLYGNYSSCADVNGAIRDDAFAAAIAAGVNLHNYNRYVLIFTSPSTWSSTCAGCADVGSCTTYTSSGTFQGGFVAINTNNMNPPFSWISGRQVGVALGCHELGHSIGMLHSGTVVPSIDTDVLGPISSPGAYHDGGDNNACNSQGTTTYIGHPAANEEAAAGWLTQSSSGYQLVQYPGSVTLAPYEGGTSGLKAVKIQRGTNNAGYYLWLEYRLQTGVYDSTSQWATNGSGVFVHYQDPTTDGRQGYLVNLNPQMNTSGGVWMHPEMQVGQRWTDNYSDVSITVLSQDLTGATIQIDYANGGGGSTTSGGGGSTGTTSLSDTVSVASATYSRNQIVPITSLSSSGSTPIAGAAITFTMTTPNGRKASQNGMSSSNGQVTWSYKLPKNPSKGMYSVWATATYAGTTVSSNIANFNVQ